jgi:hypothetical protein
VVPGSSFVASDEFGESLVVLCEFAYPGGANPHAVLAVIDEAWHGAISALTLDDGPIGKRRRKLEKDTRRKGGEFREVTAAEAGALLRDGVASFWKKGSAPGADVRLPRSDLDLVTARAAVLAPGAPDVITAEERWPRPARLELVDEFLTSPYAAGLVDPVSRMVPRVLAADCVQSLGCDPTLIGPVVLERLLLRVLPRTLLAPDRFGEAIPPVVEAWAEWLAERNQLPASSRRRLMTRTRLTLLRFARIWYGPDAYPMRRYVDDLSDSEAADGAVISEVVERRRFAIPAPADRVAGFVPGDTLSAGELDAAVEGDRALIATLEVSARGLPPQRIPSYVAVTRQLWDNDPPEVWEAARRMMDADRSREAALDRLARAWERAGADDDHYAAALGELPNS